MVDYAHTPDAMSKVLTAARALTSGSIYVVFGCTGEETGINVRRCPRLPASMLITL